MPFFHRLLDSAVANTKLVHAWSSTLASRPRGGTGTRANRHILLFAWEFPPSISGGVYRAAALARYAGRAGWQVTVISGPATEQPSRAGISLLDYAGDAVRNVRVPSPSLRPSYKLFPQVDGNLLSGIEMFGLARRELAKSRPSVVVATGPPFHDFIAGYFSSKWAGASLILDYRDEWTQCPFDFVAKGGANAVWERRCLSAADHVIFTTDSQRKRLNRLYGVGLTAKSEVIPNGWEPGDFEGSPLNPENRETWPLTLMFAGKLGGHTDPQRFLAALTRLLERKPEWRDQLRVRLVGPKLDSVAALLAQFPYPQVLQDVPLVPREEAAALMKSADALLLFHDARFERYLPGKLFEYMAAHKPILVVDDIGETRRLVESLEAGCAIDSSDIDALEAVFAQLATRTLWSRNEKRDEWLSRHTRERLTGRFLTLFDRAQ